MKSKGHYYARFSSRSKSPQRTTWPLKTTRKQVAQKQLRRLEEAWAEGQFDPWTDKGWLTSTVPLSDAAEAFMQAKRERGLRPSTLERYDVVLRQLQEALPMGVNLADVEASDLRPYVYDPSVSNSTQRNRRRHVKAFFNWCIDEGHVDGSSPVADVDAPRRETKVAATLAPEDVEKIFAAVDAHELMRKGEPGGNPDDNHWLPDLITLGINSGLRRSEMLNLEWRDLDLSSDPGLITIRNRDGFKSKSGKEDVVPLVAGALNAMRARHDRVDPLPTDKVFCDSKQRPIKPDRASRRFKKYVRLAQLPHRDNLKLHSLRHTCGSMLARQGVPQVVIRDILRHASVSTTERYTHGSDALTTRAMQEVFGRR